MQVQRMIKIGKEGGKERRKCIGCPVKGKKNKGEDRREKRRTGNKRLKKKGGSRRVVKGNSVRS